MNMFFGGRLKGMPPKLVSDDGRNIVIRPLAYVAETDLERWAAHRQFPIIPCTLCGSQDNLQRVQIKQMLREWERQLPRPHRQHVHRDGQHRALAPDGPEPLPVRDAPSHGRRRCRAATGLRRRDEACGTPAARCRARRDPAAGDRASLTSLRRRHSARCALAAGLRCRGLRLLAGCAALNTPDAATCRATAHWPAERKPGSYAFERLPSQQAQPAAAATRSRPRRAPALEAGRLQRRPPTAASADVWCRSARASRGTDYGYYDDPFWWRGGLWLRPRRRPLAGCGSGFGHRLPRRPRYEREVALLIRDRKSGQPLYETRASNDGRLAGDRSRCCRRCSRRR